MTDAHTIDPLGDPFDDGRDQLGRRRGADPLAGDDRGEPYDERDDEERDEADDDASGEALDETDDDASGEAPDEGDDDDDEIERVVPRTARGKDESEKLDQFLLRRYHLHGDRRARDQLITMYLPLVRSLARRYSSRGEHFDDLVQVGSIGLIKAIDRFDLTRGVELTTYATPNIIGEIKRYFRDKGWSVRVPRGLQELNIRLNKVIDELVPKLQRSPTINEIAEAAGATPEEVLEALETSQAYNSVSLQAAPNGESGDDETGLIDYMGTEEEAYDTMEDRTMLAPGFAKLDARERYILHLRFFEGLTQSQIAARVGISQMHVSRLIRRALEKLRANIGEGAL
ncbi:MAG TPA: RNA polymerase sigma factor SigF [Thermoleophilia bacterium]|nr:RNA polymerase sigma factor SigF [Thermoleophilia bacterium]